MTWETETFEFRNIDFRHIERGLAFQEARLEAASADVEKVELNLRTLEAERATNWLAYEDVEKIDEYDELKLVMDVNFELIGGDDAPLYMQALCEQTRMEELRPLSSPSSGHETVELTFDIANLRSELLIRIVEVQKDTGVVTGMSEGVSVHIDPPSGPIPGGFVKFVPSDKFNDMGAEHALYYLDLSDMNNPRVLINENLVSVTELLIDITSKVGPRGRLKTFVEDQIVASVWAELASVAADRAYNKEEQSVDSDVLEGDAWYGGVLVQVGRLAGIQAEDDSELVAQVVEQLSDSYARHEVFARLQSRLGRLKSKKGVGRSLEELINELF